MGLLDRILKVGARAAERAVSRAVNDTVYETVDKGIRSGIKQAKEAVGMPTSSQSTSTSSAPAQKVNTTPSAPGNEDTYDDRPFAQKLPDVLKKIGDFEIKENITADSIEAEAGRELYTRGGCYRLPKDISYAIYKDGQRVLFINLYDCYKVYARQANYKIREYCNEQGTPMMDFFDYMTNDVDYMEDRIRKAIG